MDTLISEANIDAKTQIYHEKGEDREDIFSRILSESKSSDLTFLGMLPPDIKAYEVDQEKEVARYTIYYQQMIDRIKDMPPVALSFANQDLDFHKIFTSK